MSGLSEKEIKREIELMRELSDELMKDPEKAKAFLHATGMYTKDGNLKKEFQ